MADAKDIDETLARHLFRVDAENGLLIRRVTRAHNALAGDAVGSLEKRGYLHVNVLGRFWLVHRVIFLLHYGWQPYRIDHKDTDKLNNRPDNLRPTTDHLNVGNVAMFAHNTSGYRGVSLNARSGLWVAQIKIAGKQTYLGRYTTPEEAARVYAEAAKAHFGDHARVPF